MKVAHVFWSLSFGGIETMLVNIANAQAQLGAEIHVILINDLYEQSLLDKFSEKIHVHLLNRKVGSKGFGFIWKLNKELRRINPDKIHLHGLGLYAMIFGRRLSHEASLTLHDLPVTPVRHAPVFQSLVAKLTLGIKYREEIVTEVPKVFAISTAVQEAFHDKYGIGSTVVCNGIMTSNFKKREMHQPSSPFHVVQVSRLDHVKKGQDLLIKATSILKGKVDVTFIGDGESMKYLKELAHSLNADEYIHFLGKQSQEYIAEHLRDYDLFVQPSRREGFGLTVAEAMAAKVPVLVSSGQGPAEVTEGDKYGWVFENGDVQDLVKQMESIFEHSTEVADKTNRAYDHVCSHYDVAVTARKYLELY